MSLQPAQHDEISPEHQAQILARLDEATQTSATVQPSRSSHDLWPKFVAAPTVPWGVVLEDLL